MKKSIYILACAGLMAVSCGEELLETRSSSSSDSETMFSNETYAEAAVMNIYRQFGVDKSYRNRWLVYYGANTDSEWYVSASPDKPTDTKTLIYTYNPTYDDAGSQLNESSGQFALMYTAIENANLAIAGLRKYGSVETDAGMRYLLGESLVLRAFFYFDLIKAWGDVPMRFQPIGETGDVNKPRSDRDEIYKQIIADLEEAVDYVDWPGEGVRTGTVTRVNKAFAYGLLARVCLSAAGYAQRPDEGRIGRHRLEPSQQAGRSGAGVGRQHPLHQGSRCLQGGDRQGERLREAGRFVRGDLARHDEAPGIGRGRNPLRDSFRRQPRPVDEQLRHPARHG